MPCGRRAPVNFRHIVHWHVEFCGICYICKNEEETGTLYAFRWPFCIGREGYGISKQRQPPVTEREVLVWDMLLWIAGDYAKC